MINNSGWSNRYRHDEIATDADRIELSAIQYKRSSVEATPDPDRLIGLGSDSVEPGEISTPELHGVSKSDLDKDSLNGRILEELERRSYLMGKAYPFLVNGQQLQYTGPSPSGVYEHCLYLTQANPKRGASFAKETATFERRVASLLKHYWGNGSCRIRTGHPRESYLPANWEVLGKKIADWSGEWKWNPSSLITDAEVAAVQDEGLDAIVRTPWPDRRPGALHWIVQCAAGENMWEKTEDITVKKLERWFRPLGAFAPLKIIAVPRHIPSNIVFHRLTEEGGILLDRARLTLMAQIIIKRITKRRVKIAPPLQTMAEAPHFQ